MGHTEAVPTASRDLKKRATVIYRRDEQILFVRKRNAKWSLPGGRVEQGETPLEAALREMVEETGLRFEQLSYVSQYEEQKILHFLFEAPLVVQKPRPRNEIDDCRWFTARDVDNRNVRPSIRLLLRQCATRATPANHAGE